MITFKIQSQNTLIPYYSISVFCLWTDAQSYRHLNSTGLVIGNRMAQFHSFSTGYQLSLLIHLLNLPFVLSPHTKPHCTLQSRESHTISDSHIPALSGNTATSTCTMYMYTMYMYHLHVYTRTYRLYGECFLGKCALCVCTEQVPMCVLHQIRTKSLALGDNPIMQPSYRLVKVCLYSSSPPRGQVIQPSGC